MGLLLPRLAPPRDAHGVGDVVDMHVDAPLAPRLHASLEVTWVHRTLRRADLDALPARGGARARGRPSV